MQSLIFCEFFFLLLWFSFTFNDWRDAFLLWTKCSHDYEFFSIEGRVFCYCRRPRQSMTITENCAAVPSINENNSIVTFVSHSRFTFIWATGAAVSLFLYLFLFLLHSWRVENWWYSFWSLFFAAYFHILNRFTIYAYTQILFIAKEDAFALLQFSFYFFSVSFSLFLWYCCQITRSRCDYLRNATSKQITAIHCRSYMNILRWKMHIFTRCLFCVWEKSMWKTQPHTNTMTIFYNYWSHLFYFFFAF